MSKIIKDWPSDVPVKDTLVIVPPGTRLYVENNNPRETISITGEEWLGVVIGYKEFVEEEYDYSIDYIEVLIGDRIYNVLRTPSEKQPYFNLPRVRDV